MSTFSRRISDYVTLTVDDIKIYRDGLLNTVIRFTVATHTNDGECLNIYMDEPYALCNVPFRDLPLNKTFKDALLDKAVSLYNVMQEREQNYIESAIELMYMQ